MSATWIKCQTLLRLLCLQFQEFVSSGPRCFQDYITEEKTIIPGWIRPGKDLIAQWLNTLFLTGVVILNIQAFPNLQTFLEIMSICRLRVSTLWSTRSETASIILFIWAVIVFHNKTKQCTADIPVYIKILCWTVLFYQFEIRLTVTVPTHPFPMAGLTSFDRIFRPKQVRLWHNVDTYCHL